MLSCAGSSPDAPVFQRDFKHLRGCFVVVKTLLEGFSVVIFKEIFEKLALTNVFETIGRCA